MNISLSAPDIGERELEYVGRVLRSNQLSIGPWLERFEKQFASYVGTRYAIAVNSGTSALHLCVRALEIGSNDEVITTSFSFVASVSCFLYEGALPALVDIDPETLNLDPAAVRAFLENECERSRDGSLLDSRTGRVVKAILPVHIFGLPCPMDELMDIAREYGLAVIEDACEAIGADFQGKHVGRFGNAGVFAFYPNKQMTTGEGGMIVTDDARIAELCRSMRNQGRDTDGAWLRHVRLGYNYRLSEVHAALGLAQLERIDSLLASRAGVAARYTAALSDEPGLALVGDLPGAKRSWFVYVVRFRSESPAAVRESVRSELKKKGIATQIYFTPIHRQPFFQQCCPALAVDLPNTDRAAEECLAIPFHARLGDSEIHYVCDALKEALAIATPERSLTREAIPAVSTPAVEA